MLTDMLTVIIPDMHTATIVAIVILFPVFLLILSVEIYLAKGKNSVRVQEESATNLDAAPVGTRAVVTRKPISTPAGHSPEENPTSLLNPARNEKARNAKRCAGG